MSRRSESPAPARLFVDSGGWIALFSARDGHHAEADRMFREAIRLKIPLITSNLIVAEVHRLLLYRAGIKAATAAVERIDASRSVALKFPDAAVHREARAWCERLGDQVITYTDAASFALMKASDCSTVLGFDRDFEVAGFTLWRLRR